MDLSEKLIKYSQSGVYPMHMPGHKRNTEFYPDVNPFSLDITEIDGFDNLHNPTDVLKAEEERLAHIYGACESVISVNGSTGAILSVVYAATNEGDTVIMARNCHISVYHAAMLQKLKVVFVNPEIDSETGICLSVSPEKIEEALKKHNAKLVILTSPTYDGVVSDIKRISTIAHKHNANVLVDEAHGAHFAFSDYFPESAVNCDADFIVNSLHKTLPCFTSSAVIHINNTSFSQKIRNAIDIFETSSPSYVILSGISHCMNVLDGRKDELFNNYINRLDDFYRKAKTLCHLSVLDFSEHSGIFGFDKGKIIVSTTGCNINAGELYNALLKKYKIQCEMKSAQYLICMTSVADTDDGFQRLSDALISIDKTLSKQKTDKFSFSLPQGSDFIVMRNYENAPKASIPFENSVGELAGDFVYAYPPGVPLVVPGEVITNDTVEIIRRYKKSGVSVLSAGGEVTEKLPVLRIDNN